jgi:thiamine-monophosphate kinase
MKPWQISRKSIVSSASDLAAKGARPIAAMVSVGMPPGFDKSFIAGLADGFLRASREFGVRIAGGDTNEAKEFVIDCCMLGRTGTAKMPRRSGAKPGNVVVVSGKFGLPPAGLSILQKGSRSSGDFKKRAVDSVLEPVPRQKFGVTLARYFSSSIDSSDGLATSLYELARSSHVDIRIDTVPGVEGIQKFADANNLEANEMIFHGGEEYEIIATIPMARFASARATAKKTGIDLNAVGIVTKGSGRVFVGKKRLEHRGYVHFNSR